MNHLIYASRAVARFDTDALTALLEQSRARNGSLDVTGLLLFAQGSFLQVLEGPDAAVDEVYASIERDERHAGVRLLCREPIGERRFPDWTMGFETPDEDRLAHELPGYRPATQYPFVAGDLVPNAGVALTLFDLYRGAGASA
jgi:hypothetical protein